MSKPLVMADPQIRHVDADADGILIEITDGYTEIPLHFSGRDALDKFLTNLSTALRITKAGFRYGQTKAVTPSRKAESIH